MERKDATVTYVTTLKNKNNLRKYLYRADGRHYGVVFSLTENDDDCWRDVEEDYWAYRLYEANENGAEVGNQRVATGESPCCPDDLDAIAQLIAEQLADLEKA